MTNPTPEDRAAKVIDSAKWLIREPDGSVTFKGRVAAADIAAAICEAVEAESAKWAKGAKVQIPTESMEQEFAAHYRRGAKAEREACAKIADIWANTKPVAGPVAGIIATAQSAAGIEIAKSIRARSTQQGS